VNGEPTEFEIDLHRLGVFRSQRRGDLLSIEILRCIDTVTALGVHDHGCAEDLIGGEQFRFHAARILVGITDDPTCSDLV